MTWISFHFDSNSCWGTVQSPDGWDRLVGAAQEAGKSRESTVRWLLAGRIATFDHPNTLVEAGMLPSFGYRREHVGGAQTLREWAENNGMLERLV